MRARSLVIGILIGLAGLDSAEAQTSNSCQLIFHSSRTRDVRRYEYFKQWLERNHKTPTVLDDSFKHFADYSIPNRVIRVAPRITPLTKRFVIVHEGVHSKTDVDLTRDPSIEHAARAIVFQSFKGSNLNQMRPVEIQNTPGAPQIPSTYAETLFVDERLAWRKELNAYERELNNSTLDNRPDLEFLKTETAWRRTTTESFENAIPILLTGARDGVARLNEGIVDFKTAADLVDQTPYANRSDVIVLKFMMFARPGQSGYFFTVPVYAPGETAVATREQTRARVALALETLNYALQTSVSP